MPARKQSDAGTRPVGRPKGTATQRVYDGVRAKIMHLEIPPGSDIEEAVLEKEFGVSRTPVREALIQLASEGLITLLPNRGARVTSVDISELPQLFEALEICQRLVMRWSAMRRDENDLARIGALSDRFTRAAVARNFVEMSEVNRAFHMAIAGSCGNTYVAEFYESLLSMTVRLARAAFGGAFKEDTSFQDYYDEVVRHHEAMVEAVAAGDVERADQLARDHTELFRARIVRHLETSAAAAVPIDPV